MKKVKGKVMAATMAAVMVVGTAGPVLADVDGGIRGAEGVTDIKLIDLDDLKGSKEIDTENTDDVIRRALEERDRGKPKKEIYIRGSMSEEEKEKELEKIKKMELEKKRGINNEVDGDIELINEVEEDIELINEVEEDIELINEDVEKEETKEEVASKLEWDAVEAALRLEEVDLIEGYGDGDMGLEDEITRAQMAAILARAFATYEETEAAALSRDMKFKDVDMDAWFSGVVNVAYAKGWIVGDGEGNFRPNDPVQYREAMTMLMRAVGYTEELVTGQWPHNYVDKAEELQLTSGELKTGEVHEEDFTSNKNAPRGDIFIVLDRVMDYENSTILEKYKPVTQ